MRDVYEEGWPIWWQGGEPRVPWLALRRWDRSARLDITAWQQDNEPEVTLTIDCGYGHVGDEHEVTLTATQVRELMRGVEWAEAASGYNHADQEQA